MNKNKCRSQFKKLTFTSLVIAFGWNFYSVASPTEQYPQSRIVDYQTMAGKIEKNNISCAHYSGSWGGNPYSKEIRINTQSLRTPNGVSFPNYMVMSDLWQSEEINCATVNLFLQKSSELISYSATFTIQEYVSMSLVKGQEVCSKYSDKSFTLSFSDPSSGKTYSLFGLGPSQKKLLGTTIVDVASNDFCNLNLFQ
ncbi:MAG TPA: hypothetical protein VIG33_12485 [Pseudobdellovibrionaceae bacterium]|jgi:hypothetical protein